MPQLRKFMAETVRAHYYFITACLIGVLLPYAAAANEKAAHALATVAEPVAAGNVVQVSLGLLLVLVAIAGTAWVLRRFTHAHSGARGAVQVLGGVALGPRERIALIQVGDKQILIGVAPGRVQTLYVLEQPVSFAHHNEGTPPDFTGRFLHAFKHNLAQYKSGKRAGTP